MNYRHDDQSNNTIIAHFLVSVGHPAFYSPSIRPAKTGPILKRSQTANETRYLKSSHHWEQVFYHLMDADMISPAYRIRDPKRLCPHPRQR